MEQTEEPEKKTGDAERLTKTDEAEGGSSSPDQAEIAAQNRKKAKELFKKWVYQPINLTIDWLDEHNGFVTALATVAIAVLTYFVAHVMGGQLDEMQSGSTDTHALAVAAQDQADAAKKQAIAAAQQAVVMQGQLDAMQREDRPFIGQADPFLFPAIINAPNGSFELIWNYQFTNFGKTNAEGLSQLEYIKLGNGVFQLSAGPQPVYAGELPPGKVQFTSVVSQPDSDQAGFAKLIAANEGISILVEFTYFDGPGTKYQNAFCASLLASKAIESLDPRKCEALIQK